jgi:hypothetical protein
MYYRSMADELEKIALLERVVRLGATPIKGTPKLFMKSRSPQELKVLQEAVSAGWDKRVTDPIMRVAEKGLKKLPKGRAERVARKGARLVAEDPLGGAVTIAAPGGSVYPFAKKGLERLIDRLSPLPA